MSSWSSLLECIFEGVKQESSAITSKAAQINMRSAVRGTNYYLVSGFDSHALLFSYPLLINIELIDFANSPKIGSDGAVAEIIEEIKREVKVKKELRPLGALDTTSPMNMAANIEPVTFCKVSEGTAQRLWKADSQNYYSDADGLHLNIIGALPLPDSQSKSAQLDIIRSLAELTDAICDCALKFRDRENERIERAVINSSDQKMLREKLDSMGLCAFIKDGARPVRRYTQYRAYYRIAGCYEGESGNIPFVCPDELTPIEVELGVSHNVVTGLGIRKKELFAIIGSNAEGKSTFIDMIRSGIDDHLIGDGREGVVTKSGCATVESSEADITGADISIFFSKLPAGCSGTPTSIIGRGSGSMGMAAQFSAALRKRASMIIIDEDRSATNLLVPNCMQSLYVTPLSELLRRQRIDGDAKNLGGMKGLFGDTSIVFAAATMDILVAEADRILRFDNHHACGISRDEFRKKLKEYLSSVITEL